MAKTSEGSPRGSGMSETATARVRSGGPPHEGATSYNDGRRAGFVEGATSMIKAAAQEGEAMQEGVGKLVIGKLLAKLERQFPDAQQLYPPLKTVAEGKFDD